MRNLARYFLVFLILLCTSCGGGSYMPTPIEIRVTVQNESLEPLKGIQCVLYRNNIELLATTTDKNGKCTLITEIGAEDSYLLLDDFFSQLKITISDIDGSNNGGIFVSQEYTPQAFLDVNITLSLVN